MSATALTGQDIINRFERLVDDTTELSTSEELELLNDKYRELLADRPWEFLRKQYLGTTDGTQYVNLPDDFAYTVDNQNYTDINVETSTGKRANILFIGSLYAPYTIVNYNDRLQYRNNTNVAWIDIANNRIEFSVNQTTGQQVIFDYIYDPDDITIGTSPVIPARFHPILAYAMAVDDMAMQLFDKAKSYAGENNAKYEKILRNMQYWNAQLQQQ